MNIIGRRDKIDLPGLEIFDIKAKVDTGAYGCALHCHHIKIIEKDGKKVLSFQVLDPSYVDFEDHIFHFEHFEDRIIRNSGGETEHRYIIKTELVIFNTKETVEFSLTNRAKMKYPVLLGRKFLTGKFLVDVQLKYLSHRQKNKGADA